jgi:hypothetical protein
MPTAASVEREFLDLIYADDELVRAEFDEIIDFSWTRPAPRSSARPGPPVDQGWPDADHPPVTANGHRGHRALARQRAPPVTDLCA